uniref:Uncharacterized protein n=1 Tax=viral metagenome TaxID=1070528 RepID=A0A6M3LNC1_9ZZZZ
MQYLLIENLKECPIEGFTILGLSTARDNEDAIGQFGSGNKHAALLCMRSGINPIIYSGKTRIRFYSEPAVMEGGKNYNKVFIQIDNAKAKEANFCLEFGELDWTSLDMGLREFVSNAIDNGGFNPFMLSIVDKPRAKAGTTRIYVPLTPEVQRFYSDISCRFLHYSGKEKERIIEKKVPGKTRIYRKGVFVREVREDGLFDYNFGDEVKIDECRNMNDYTARSKASQLLCKSQKAIEKVLRSFKDGKEYFEHTFSHYAMMYEKKEIWQNAWKNVFGDAVCCSDNLFIGILTRKGFTCQVIENTEWMETLKYYEVRTEKETLSVVEQKGQEILPASLNAVNTLHTVWEWLTDVNMTNKKERPEIACFSKLVDAESTLRGYYQDGTVYLNIEEDTNKQTMLEELAHYITGSTDMSRDFQEFAFLFGKRMAEIIYE